MRDDWDSRARENARHYVATLKDEWTDKDFIDSGRIWVERYIIPDLRLICGNRPPSELRVLELGAGAGRMTLCLSEIFGTVDAVDVSPEMISRAKIAVRGRHNVCFHINNGLDLQSFDRESFDFAFSAIVFQHIPRKSVVKNYIREVHRVLRKGSVFKFQVQGYPIDEVDADTWQGVGFDEAEVRRLAKKIGFTIHDIYGMGTQDFWVTFMKL